MISQGCCLAFDNLRLASRCPVSLRFGEPVGRILRAIPVVALLGALMVGLPIGENNSAHAVPTWTVLTDIATENTPEEGDLAVSADGSVVHAVWRAYVGGDFQIQSARYSSGSWSGVTTHTSGSVNAYDARIFSSDDGSIVTLSWTMTGPSSNRDIYVASSNDSGATWTSPVQLSNSSYNSGTQIIDGSSNGTFQYVSWNEWNGSGWFVKIAKSSNSGVSWSAATTLSGSGVDARGGIAVSDDGATVHVIWRRYVSSKYQAESTSSTNSGSSWSTIKVHSDTVTRTHVFEPRIASSSDGTVVYATWLEGSTTEVTVQQSSDSGANWGAWTTPGTGSRQQLSPSVVVSDDGTIAAVSWRETDGSNFLARVAVYASGSPTAFTLSEAGQTVQPPVLTGSGDGSTIAVAWDRPDGANDAVQAAISSDSGSSFSVQTVVSSGVNQYSPDLVAARDGSSTFATWSSLGEGIKFAKFSEPSVSSGGSSSASAGVPGIFLSVNGVLLGNQVQGSPVYYGADRVAVTSTYVLTVTKVSNVAPSVVTLAEGTIGADGSFSSMVRLPELAPGTYNVRMSGTHTNGATLQLTSQVTVGAGVFTSIGANIPVIR